MNAELVRIVDGIARDKNIDKEAVLVDLEQAMISAIRKAFGQAEEVDVQIDRLSGDITATMNGAPIEMRDLGRIAAQTATQVMIQKIREAERGAIYEEFTERKNTVVTGTVVRYEGGALVVNLGRTEGFLPRSEQIPGESHHPGERIRCLVLEVREAPNQVKIVLSRSHPEFIRRLFELEVPEVAERIIEVRALAREAGYRTKIAVSSIDMKVDAVGACVGVRGSRIKNIVAELGGEKIDIVRWNESSQILISNALKPAEVSETALCFELNRATVVVPEDQLSLAIGKRGQNVRLAARLTGWDIDILTPAEYNKGLDEMERVLTGVEGLDNEKIEKMMALGIVSLADIVEIGTDPLLNVLALTPELAEKVISVSSEASKRLAEEAEEAKRLAKEAAEAQASAEQQAAPAEAGLESTPEEAGQATGQEPAPGASDSALAGTADAGRVAPSAGPVEASGPETAPDAPAPDDSQESQADRTTAPDLS